MKGATVARALASLLGVALGAVSCGSEQVPYGAPIGADGTWPVSVRLPENVEPEFDRVILFTLDTLRADHVSAYGYFRRTTPFLDSLAEHGVLFENAIAAVSQTAPSHASMLTGLSLYEHGVSENGYELSTDANDLARVFSAAGFDTAAFLSVGFLGEIARNFDHVDFKVQNGFKVTADALGWLGAPERARSSFLWIHLYDPHRWRFKDAPPPDQLAAIRRRTQGDDAEVYGRLADLHGLREPISPEISGLDWVVSTPGGGPIQGETTRDYLEFIEIYDALILFDDQALRQFYGAVQQLGLPGRTLWIVTSDHGEGLASHQVAGHGNRLFQEQLRVPLILHASDDSLAPRRVKNLVQLVDLYPTLLDSIGAHVTGLSGELNASSLWPLIRGAAGQPDRMAFSQRRWIDDDAGEDRGGYKPQSQTNPSGTTDLGELFAIQDERYKYLKGEQTEQLYDLSNDPLELRNIAAESPAEVARMRALLEQRLEYYRTRRPPKRTQELSEETQAELRALGYVD